MVLELCIPWILLVLDDIHTCLDFPVQFMLCCYPQQRCDHNSYGMRCCCIASVESERQGAQCTNWVKRSGFSCRLLSKTGTLRRIVFTRGFCKRAGFTSLARPKRDTRREQLMRGMPEEEGRPPNWVTEGATRRRTIALEPRFDEMLKLDRRGPSFHHVFLP